MYIRITTWHETAKLRVSFDLCAAVRALDMWISFGTHEIKHQ